MKNRYENLLGRSKDMGRPFSASRARSEGQGGSWRLLLLGAVVGIVFVVLGASGYHYSGSSSFCRSCHSMASAGDQWRLSMHKQFKCTECHLPAGNTFERMAYKARAGMNDLLHEITGNYPVFIRLSGEGRGIADGNCLRCHFSTVERTPMILKGEDCVRCHRYLVHGKGTDR